MKLKKFLSFKLEFLKLIKITTLETYNISAQAILKSCQLGVTSVIKK